MLPIKLWQNQILFLATQQKLLEGILLRTTAHIEYTCAEAKKAAGLQKWLTAQICLKQKQYLLLKKAESKTFDFFILFFIVADAIHLNSVRVNFRWLHNLNCAKSAKSANIKYIEGELDMFRREGSDSGFGGPRRSFAPVKVGEELDVKIEAVGEKGDGIAKKNGFVLFVPGVKEGQEVRIRVTKVLRKVGFAEVVGKGSAPAAEGEASESSEESGESSEEAAPAEESEEPSEDSENFGEETEE